MGQFAALNFGLSERNFGPKKAKFAAENFNFGEIKGQN